MTEIAEALPRAEGFHTERFDIEKEELHGTAELKKGRLTLYLTNCEHAANQTVVRIFWAKKHALDVPRPPGEEPSGSICGLSDARLEQYNRNDGVSLTVDGRQAES